MKGRWCSGTRAASIAGRLRRSIGEPLAGGRVCALVATLALGSASCGNDVVVEPWGATGVAGASASAGAGGGSTTSATASNGGAGATASSSTGTVTSTTSTTTTIWGPGLCNVGNCYECVAGECMVETCTTEITACEDSDECAPLRACILSCDMDAICAVQCKQMYPGGYDVLMALLTCERCVACYGDCLGPGGQALCPTTY